jgi:hypothetical protein
MASWWRTIGALRAVARYSAECRSETDDPGLVMVDPMTTAQIAAAVGTEGRPVDGGGEGVVGRRALDASLLPLGAL